MKTNTKDLLKQREELLPCPFCGGKATHMNFTADYMKNASVACVKCRASSGIHTETSTDSEPYKKAMSDWNTRANHDKAIIDDLLEENRRLSLEVSQNDYSSDKTADYINILEKERKELRAMLLAVTRSDCLPQIHTSCADLWAKTSRLPTKDEALQQLDKGEV